MTVHVEPNGRPWYDMKAPVVTGDDPEEVVRKAVEIAMQRGEAYAITKEMVGGEWEGAHIEKKNGVLEVTVRATSDYDLSPDELREGEEVVLREVDLGDADVYGVQNPATDEFYAVAVKTLRLDASAPVEAIVEKILEALDEAARLANDYFDEVVVVREAAYA